MVSKTLEVAIITSILGAIGGAFITSVFLADGSNSQYLSAVILATGGILIISAACFFYQNYKDCHDLLYRERVLLDNEVTKETIVRKFEKIATISDDATKDSFIHVTYSLAIPEGVTYNSIVHTIRSDCKLDKECFSVTVGGGDRTDFIATYTFEDPDDPQRRKVHRYDLKIPLQDDDKQKDLEIKYPTKSFPKLYEDSVEGSGFTVHYAMDEAVCRVILSKDAAKRYRLTTEVGKTHNWYVCDYSRSPSNTYRNRLKNRGEMPEIIKHGKEIVWTISKPKIDRKFLMFFKFIDKTIINSILPPSVASTNQTDEGIDEDDNSDSDVCKNNTQ